MRALILSNPVNTGYFTTKAEGKRTGLGLSVSGPHWRYPHSHRHAPPTLAIKVVNVIRGGRWRKSCDLA